MSRSKGVRTNDPQNWKKNWLYGLLEPILHLGLCGSPNEVQRACTAGCRGKMPTGADWPADRLNGPVGARGDWHCWGKQADLRARRASKRGSLRDWARSGAQQARRAGKGNGGNLASGRPNGVQLGQPSTGEGAGSQGASPDGRRFNGAGTFEKVPGASGDVQTQMRFSGHAGRPREAGGPSAQMGRAGGPRARDDAGWPRGETRFTRAGRRARIPEASRILQALLEAARRGQRGAGGPRTRGAHGPVARQNEVHCQNLPENSRTSQIAPKPPKQGQTRGKTPTTS